MCGSGRRRARARCLGVGFSQSALLRQITLNVLFDSYNNTNASSNPPDPAICPTLPHPHPLSLYIEPPPPSIFFRLGPNNSPPLFFFSAEPPQAPSRNPTRIMLRVRELVTWPRNADAAAIVAWPLAQFLAHRAAPRSAQGTRQGRRVGVRRPGGMGVRVRGSSSASAVFGLRVRAWRVCGR